MRRDLLILMVLAAGAAAAPAVVYPVFGMKLLCFALFACAYNLLAGYAGLLSLGHAMFFGMAAYVCAYTTKVWEWPVALSVLAGTASAAGLGVVSGIIAIRRQGIYFGMVTLALAQMVYFFCVQATDFTGGEDGIQAVPRRPLFGVLDIENDIVLYYVVLAVFCAGFITIWRVIHSPFGEVLRAIRENEERASSLGYKVDRFKLTAFILSAAFAGLSGAMMAIVFRLASLSGVSWMVSGEGVMMLLVGGLGTVFGPVVGAAVVVTIESYIASAGQWVLVIQGTIFVVVVLVFRKGIVGELEEFLRRRRVARAANVASAAAARASLPMHNT